MNSLEKIFAQLWSVLQARFQDLPFFFDDFDAILSILIFSVLLYKGYQALVRSGAQELFYGILSIGMFYALALLLRLEFLLWLLDKIIPTLLVILAIVLQPELRRLFVQIGRQGRLYHSSRDHQTFDVLRSMLDVCEQLVQLRRGALIVFCRENMLSNIVGSGIVLDARPSYELITSLFAHDTLLHDGAVIVRGARIRAAGCVLPIAAKATQNVQSAPNIQSKGAEAKDPANFGTRHRAAIELASDTDAVVLVVSEESGHISLAFDGQFALGLSSVEILETLKALLMDKPQKKWSIRRVLERILPFYGRSEN